jgi:Sec-independent protein translocase protein TatA
VGAPEIAVTLLVGYFVLGPSDLYKLVKEIGKFIQNVRTLGTEAAKSFEGTMEDQLELTELRKAQSELNAAFGFRRSINTDEYASPFDRTGFGEDGAGYYGADGAAAASPTAAAASATTEGGEAAAGAATGAAGRKRRLVRRKKKKAPDPAEAAAEAGGEAGGEDGPAIRTFASAYPDLDALDDDDGDAPPFAAKGGRRRSAVEEMRAGRAERLAAASSAGEKKDDDATIDWFSASEGDVASAVLLDRKEAYDDYDFPTASSNDRFRSQLSADEWNSRVMANEDKLSPRE